MTTQSKIEWTGPTLNTVVGCTPQGPECDNCYADDEVHRFARVYTDRPGLVTIRGPAKKPGLTWLPTDAEGRSLGKGAKWTGGMVCLPHKMLELLATATPDDWFVNSLSDLFHKTLVDDPFGFRFIAANLGLFAVAPQHRGQILTKQPEAAERFFDRLAVEASKRRISPALLCVLELITELRRASASCPGTKHARAFDKAAEDVAERWRLRGQTNRCFVSKRQLAHGVDKIRDVWPLPNVHLGVSVGLARTKHKLDTLRTMPAAVRFVSFEPLLEHLGDLDMTDIHWAIVGGESGAKARPCEVPWIRSIVHQCRAQGAAVFVKQLGAKPLARSVDDLGEEAFMAYDGQNGSGPFPANGWSPKLRDAKGGTMSEWPEDLRIREMPEVA